MQRHTLVLVGILTVTLLGGCHEAKAPAPVTSQDIEATQREAAREVAEARIEAAKDIKSAAKVSGADPKVVTDAKVVGSYDVTMAKADGDHKVATEKCLTLPTDQQAACKAQADADYESNKATAKAARLAKQQ